MNAKDDMAAAKKVLHFGCKLTALTHGHPTGYLAGGTFAALISLIISANSLTEAIDDATLILKSDKNSWRVKWIG